MGLFDFVGDIASATVKIVATPIAVAKDVYEVATGGDVDNTKELLKSAGEDLANAPEDLIDK